MRLDIVAAPDVADRRLADSLLHRHRATTPMRAPFRLGVQGGVDHCLDAGRIVSGFPAPTGRDLPESWQALGAKPLAPQTNRLAVDAILGSDHNLRLALSDGQNDAAAERHLLRRTQDHHPLFQL